MHLSLLTLPTAACGHQVAVDVKWRFNPLCHLNLPNSPSISPIVPSSQVTESKQLQELLTFPGGKGVHPPNVCLSILPPGKPTQQWKSFKSQWEMHLQKGEICQCYVELHGGYMRRIRLSLLLLWHTYHHSNKIFVSPTYIPSTIAQVASHLFQMEHLNSLMLPDLWSSYLDRFPPTQPAP